MNFDMFVKKETFEIVPEYTIYATPEGCSSKWNIACLMLARGAGIAVVVLVREKGMEWVRLSDRYFVNSNPLALPVFQGWLNHLFSGFTRTVVNALEKA